MENVVNIVIIRLKYYFFNGMGLIIISLNVKINVNFYIKRLGVGYYEI